MTAGARRPGQPLVALGGLIGCWIAMRSLMIAMPGDAIAQARERSAPVLRPVPIARTALPIASITLPSARPRVMAASPLRHLATPIRRGAPSRVVYTRPLISGGFAAPFPPAIPRFAVPEAPAAPLVAAAPPRASAPPRPARWSGEGWLFLRQGSGGIGPGVSSLPSYGASQAGAILRYAIAPGSERRPAAYVRAVRAIDVAAESDLAAGISVRPVPALPLTAYGEVRLRRRGSALSASPAAFLAAGVDGLGLPAGFAGRGYAQAGYVGEPDATGFIDGAVMAERVMARSGAATLALGGGGWGGVQRGAGRLDIGPTATATLPLPLRGGMVRVSADYRLRIAGAASPASGAALTVSAGF